MGPGRSSTDIADAGVVSSLAACRRVLADYQAGILDDDGARVALRDAGAPLGAAADRLPLAAPVVGHLLGVIDALERALADDASTTEGWR